MANETEQKGNHRIVRARNGLEETWLIIKESLFHPFSTTTIVTGDVMPGETPGGDKNGSDDNSK
ncbi:MAG: hypothetical protein HYZ11_10145 [Candidatus Tectomicrobia bacterium]|uniref:Uncharacterized protein n=1 Tax=Tectimicrobiota bacterium TaxID=2528274 RepID=A0A932I2C7_UNCTE|nr:hypothetical protein [Candidatus Tectomicrobia bacterium]